MTEIKIKDEFIKLGQAMKFAGIVSSGTEAKLYIEEGNVLVNNETELRRGRKLYDGDVIKFREKEFIIRDGKCS